MKDLIHAYKQTKYKVFKTPIVIEVGQMNEHLEKLLNKHDVNEWAFITAFNPFSNEFNDAENIKRHTLLKNNVASYIFFEGEGRGIDKRWKPELSLLILGIAKENAIKIGVKYEQNAIVYGSKGHLPELLVLV